MGVPRLVPPAHDNKAMKVILYAAMSVDGMIAEAEDQTSTDWTSEEDYKWFVKQTKACGVVALGRKTYATINRQLKGRYMYIMTRSPEKHEPLSDDMVFTSMSPAEIVADAKDRGYEKLALIGGAQIHTLFFEAGLVDELYVTVEPVLFGHGVPFVAEQSRVKLFLID